MEYYIIFGAAIVGLLVFALTSRSSAKFTEIIMSLVVTLIFYADIVFAVLFCRTCSHLFPGIL